MYLPKIYENFSGKFPEVFKDFKQLGQTCREAGPLDQKCQDLVKLGIIDPAKVTRIALQSAASVAGLMITTEAMVSELPDDSASAGGMPDMGGMGGMM